jgi:hypothetical protein
VAYPKNTIERILRRCIKDGDCWIHPTSHDKDGYVILNYHGKRWRAHRLIFVKIVGEIPDNYEIHHTCERPSCLNPRHMEVLTKTEHGKINIRNITKWENQHLREVAQ